MARQLSLRRGMSTRPNKSAVCQLLCRNRHRQGMHCSNSKHLARNHSVKS